MVFFWRKKLEHVLVSNSPQAFRKIQFLILIFLIFKVGSRLLRKKKKVYLTMPKSPNVPSARPNTSMNPGQNVVFAFII